MSEPTVMVPARISAAPRQSTMAVQMATTIVTTGESSALTLRAFSAALTVASLTICSISSSVFSWPKALTTCIDSRPCWTTATIWLCSLRTSWVASLTAFLKRETKKSRNGVTASGDQGEVPVEPEHEAEHADDGEHVDEDVERGRRGEALDGRRCRR